MTSTSLRSRPLPQELIDLMVVELSGDWRSLEACSITAKCFRGPSQKALFKTLTLYQGSPANTRLDDAMSSNTLLPTYVQTLHLKLAPRRETIPVIRKLTSLRCLHIDGLHPYPTDWSNIHSHLQQDLLSLIQSQTLEQLIFEHLSGFPLGTLKHCPQLKDLQFLTFDRPEIKSIDPPDEAEFVTHGHLESLTTILPPITSMVMDILTDPHSCLSLSSLKRFNSVVSDPFPLDIMQFQQLLDFAAPSLEIISVIFLLGFVGFFADTDPSLTNCTDHSPGFMCLDLGSLHNLRIIHINTVNSVPISIGFAAAMLDTVPERNRLEEIKFTIAGVELLSDLGQDDDYDTSWGKLDELLTGKGHLKIRCSLITIVRSVGHDEFRSAVLQRLPKSKSRGLVEVQLIRGP